MTEHDKTEELWCNRYMSLFNDGKIGLSDGVGYLDTLSAEEVDDLYEAITKYRENEIRAYTVTLESSDYYKVQIVAKSKEEAEQIARDNYTTHKPLDSTLQLISVKEIPNK